MPLPRVSTFNSRIMVLKASDKPKFCDNDDGDDNGPVTFKRLTACEKNTWNSEVRKLVSYEDSHYDDDVPLSARLSWILNLGTCGSNCGDDSVKKRSTTLPVKRPLDEIESDSLHISVKKSKVKKSKVSPYDDDDEEEDDIPISRRIKKSAGKSADESFSITKRLIEEQRLQSLKKDIKGCSKELRNKKMQASSVRKINEAHKKVQGKIEECVTDLVTKEAQLYLMEDLIGERKLELKTKEIELRQVMKNIDKDRERKEEELKALSIKFHAMKDFESMKKQFEGQVKEFELKERQLEEQVKEFQSKEEEFEGQIKELESEKQPFESRIKELKSKEKQFEGQAKELELKEKQLEGRLKAFQSKKEEFEGQMKELESQKKHFESRVKELESKNTQLEGPLNEFESKEKELKGQAKMLKSKYKHFRSRIKKELIQIVDKIKKDYERKEEEREALSIKIAECNRELRTTRKELDEMKKLICGQAKELESERKMLRKVMSARTDHRAQMKNIESMKKQFEGQVKELESKQKQCEGQVKELASKEKHFEERVKELKSKEKQLESKEEEFEAQIKQLKSEKNHFQSRVKELESKEKQFEGRVKELESKEKQLEGEVKEFESKKVEFECQMKELESQKKPFEGQVKELQSKEKQFEGRVKELELKELKEKQLEGRLKEFESKEEEFEGQLKELESKNNHFESRLKELESKEKQLKGRLKEFEGQVKELESRKKYLKIRVKELGPKEKQFQGRVREFESKEKRLGGQAKEFQSREEEFEGRVKEFQPREEEFERRVEDIKSKEKQFEGGGKELESKENKFQVQVKEFKSKQKLFEGQVKDLELREKQYEALINSSEEEKESGNQLSLQLLPVEQRDELESLGNAILVNLLASSDPSNVVLDIIQDPIIPQCRKGHNAVTIDGGHIVLLVQLMRISPHIKPPVREKAMKLALDLKADMSENSEAVLGFILLLSIYGLVPSFDQDEVLKLFGFAAQHKTAVELFGTLGFADKISDFVQSLIRKQQHIEAVRFICAYNLTDKYQPVDLLRKHVQNAKLISERSCKKTDSIEIKDKARDEEIATLGTVLECISDNNIESEDLHNEIRDRILELNRQRRIVFVPK